MSEEKVVKFTGKDDTSKPTDNIYRLEEMLDSMISSIKNIEKISTEQLELCEILENAKTTNDFSEFIKATKEQNENIVKQKETLSKRVDQLNEVIAICTNDETAKHAVNGLVDALGIFA